MTVPKRPLGKAAHIFPELQARESGRGKGGNAQEENHREEDKQQGKAFVKATTNFSSPWSAIS